MAVNRTLFPYDRGILALNKQIRKEALDFAFDTAFAWVVVKTNIPNYRTKLLRAGFPDCLDIFLNQVKKPIATIELYLAGQPREPASIVAYPVALIEDLYRAINATGGKGDASLKVRFNDTPRPPISQIQKWHCLSTSQSLRCIQDFREVSILGQWPQQHLLCEAQHDMTMQQQERWCRMPYSEEFKHKAYASIYETLNECDKLRDCGQWKAALDKCLDCLIVFRDFSAVDDEACNDLLDVWEWSELGPSNLLLLIMSEAGQCYLELGNAEACIYLNSFASFKFRGVDEWLGWALYRRGCAFRALGLFGRAAVDFTLGHPKIFGPKNMRKEVENARDELLERLGRSRDFGIKWLHKCQNQWWQEKEEYFFEIKVQNGKENPGCFWKRDGELSDLPREFFTDD